MLACRRVVVVAAGASGIGAACTARFAAAGDRVVVVDVADPSRLSLPADASALQVDVRDSAACDAAIRSVVAEHGSVGVLVNAAGVITRATALDTTDEEWHRQFAVNVDGTFFLSRAVTRALLTTGRWSSASISGERNTKNAIACGISLHSALGVLGEGGRAVYELSPG